MILKALYDYYQAKKDSLAPQGMEYKPIRYIIVIGKNGRFIRIEDTMEDNQPKKYLVNKTVGRSSNTAPNVLWDNAKYVLGYTKNKNKNKKEQEEAQKCFKAFKEQIDEYTGKFPNNEEFTALSSFYKTHFEEINSDPLLDEIKKNSAFYISFRMEGKSTIIAENRDLDPEKEISQNNEVETNGVCLITGKKGPIVRLTTSTPIIGAKSTAKIVSFQENSGYDSYNKTKAYNSPISIEAEFAYSSALNDMLSKNSGHSFIIGNRTFIFWAIPKDKNRTKDKFEAFFTPIFDFNNDNPDNNVEAVKELLKAPKSGWLNEEGDDNFYILGLAPNAARISVQYWQKGTIKEFAENIRQHFIDLKIIGDDNIKFKSLRYLIETVTPEGNFNKNVQPNLIEAFFKSILQNTVYPTTIQQACIRRILAKKGINTLRACLLKACLNRKIRLYKYKEKEIAMALDKENSNQGYLCGRLFATLERIQETSSGSSTLRERYISAASSAPITVFGKLISLSSYYMSKLPEKGLSIYYDKIIEEIMDKISSKGMPARLNLDDQSRFMVGYYHQREFFFTKTNNEQ
jgi:CRISPR-associated protein Csd1